MLALPVGVLVGLAIGGLGGGGSVLAVPLLVYLLGQDVQAATTTSLLVVTVAALTGSASHARSGCVCWRHVGLLVAAAVPGVVAGTAVGEAIGARALLAAFAVVMVIPALLLWRRGREPAGTGQGTCPPLRARCDVGAGLVVGFLTGLFGVGGGFLIVPALALCLAFTMRAAVGTSLAIVAATSVIGLVAHLAAGRHVDWTLTAVLVAGCVLGALAGARLAQRVPPRTLTAAFTGLVVLVSGWLLVSTAVLGGPA